VQCCELVDANSTKDSYFYDLRWADCYWGDDTAIMIMLNDVTLNKRFENEITRLSNYKDELLATVSHDLKTPLNGILTILEANKSEDNIQKMREKNEIAIKNSHLLNFLIQDILDYSMINKGKLRTVCQAFDVLEAAQEIVELERE
jgi:signal transduction histidine kinase